MKNGMKTGKMAVLLGAFCLICVMTGCAEASGKAESQGEDIIRIEASADEGGRQNDESQQNDEGRQNDEGQQEQMDHPMEKANAEDGQEDGSEAMAQEETELEGDVRRIGENSMVVSQIFNYTEDDASIAVAYAGEGSDETQTDETLITVYFSEDTEYIVRTVKNGGVNGDSDVENRAATLADIREGNTVIMNGIYEGEDFHAAQVIIYNFI